MNGTEIRELARTVDSNGDAAINPSELAPLMAKIDEYTAARIADQREAAKVARKAKVRAIGMMVLDNMRLIVITAIGSGCAVLGLPMFF